MQVDPENPDARVLDGAFYQPPSLSQTEIITEWLTDWSHAVLDEDDFVSERLDRMSDANPWFIPRNYLVWQAIQSAEKGDMALFDGLFEAACAPYTEQPDLPHLVERRPEWAREQAGASMLSCSS